MSWAMRLGHQGTLGLLPRRAFSAPAEYTQLSDFSYELPDQLIAHFPCPDRSGSRLLQVDGNTGSIEHRQFEDIVDLVEPGDLMVFNNTKVIPARVYGRKATGGSLEVLVERLLGPSEALAQVKGGAKIGIGNQFFLEGLVDGKEHRLPMTLVGRKGSLFHIRLEEGPEVLAMGMEGATLLDLLNSIGHMPLPPYIKRGDEMADKLTYQTVYAKTPGAVAAPTAGLHFTERLLARLDAKGVRRAFVTLHVGAGTFQPVRVDDISEHEMHSEWLELTQEVAELVTATKANGRRVIAVGTTSVRCLETASTQHLDPYAEGAGTAALDIKAYSGETNIFIRPSYQFQCVDALVTNFHLSQSTLLMLVSAFAGYETTMKAYKEAVSSEYRFFSYGDSNFITRQIR